MSLEPIDVAARRAAVDPWRRARLGALVAYAAGYAIWFWTKGLVFDRISVVLSLVLLVAAAHIGRPWYRWRRLAVDLALYSAMWLAYEETRGAADRLGMPLQVESVRDLDRLLFFGTDPNVWLQRRFFSADVVRWYDVVASVVYHLHFVVPVVVVGVLWIADRRGWWRYMRRFATVLFVACMSFVLLPTAPPWMAAGGDRNIRLDALEPLARPAGRGWRHIGLSGFAHAWETGRDWVNAVAAMPSLHAGFALFVVAFFLPMVRRRSVRVLLLAYPLVMGLTLVYLAEHYVVDVLAGWACVGLSFLVWHRIERHRRRRLAAPLRARFGAGSPVGGPIPIRRRVFCDAALLRELSDGELSDGELSDGEPVREAGPCRDETRRAFTALLDEYESGRTELVTDALTAAELPDRDLVRVLEVVPVGRSTRRRARRVVARSSAANEREALAWCLLGDERVGEIVVRRTGRPAMEDGRATMGIGAATAGFPDSGVVISERTGR